MMLTKEECENALDNILCNIGVARSDYRTSGKAKEDYCTLNSLIEEHFSNPPLKWEEIKEHDFVFDKDFNGLGGEWLKVYMKHITNYGEKVLTCGACGSDEAQTRSYKEDRFYRKEVQE